MPPEFIFMLTKDDVTVQDALVQHAAVDDSRIHIIGFKDVGLEFEALQDLTAAIHESGREVAMEIVSLDEHSELRAAHMACVLNVDHLLGGTRPGLVAPLLSGTAIRFYPFPGTIVGHPSQLCGTVEDIIHSAQQLSETPGVTGLDVLAYRFNGDADALLTDIVDAVHVPVIAAGSIDRPERIRAVVRSGAWGFTVGGAAFDRRFVPGTDTLEAQIRAILAIRDDDTLRRQSRPKGTAA